MYWDINGFLMGRNISLWKKFRVDCLSWSVLLQLKQKWTSITMLLFDPWKWELESGVSSFIPPIIENSSPLSWCIELWLLEHNVLGHVFGESVFSEEQSSQRSESLLRSKKLSPQALHFPSLPFKVKKISHLLSPLPSLTNTPLCVSIGTVSLPHLLWDHTGAFILGCSVTILCLLHPQLDFSDSLTSLPL